MSGGDEATLHIAVGMELLSQVDDTGGSLLENAERMSWYYWRALLGANFGIDRGGEILH